MTTPVSVLDSDGCHIGTVSSVHPRHPEAGRFVAEVAGNVAGYDVEYPLAATYATAATAAAAVMVEHETRNELPDA